MTLSLSKPLKILGQDTGQNSKFIYQPEGRPDPFIPLLDSTGFLKEKGLSQQQEFNNRLTKIKINGVFWDKEMPVVMINGKFYKQNDEIFEVKIKEINYDSVVLEYYELKHEISLIEKKKFDVQGGIHDGIF